jgi:hypothetical protein
MLLHLPDPDESVPPKRTPQEIIVEAHTLRRETAQAVDALRSQMAQSGYRSLRVAANLPNLKARQAKITEAETNSDRFCILHQSKN